MYFKKAYSTKSDVFSIGIIFWEIVARLLSGSYKRPYSEYKEIKMDLQIIFKVATAQLRPSFDEFCPLSVRDLIATCWSQEPEKRPSCADLMIRVLELRKEYKRKKSKWKKVIPKPPKT
eukprot:TRINITY_DN24905_c0_g1_i1.p1 TRINITY_DN24905_c0_g1~~TRINITY_DN24905_c0_g1_i1.p1  ORF type:complete len:119 (-),score=30.66 TRINITY_DN24905_c0_g1_i1:134-490(-)